MLSCRRVYKRTTERKTEHYLQSAANPKSASGVIEVHCVAAVVVVGNQHLSVLVGPEAVEVNEDAGDDVALATVD